MKDNNKGFSLVELLVAIAIIAIVTATAALSFSMVKKTDVKQAATNLDSLTNDVRMNCMSKANLQYLYLYHDDDDGCYRYKQTFDKLNNYSAIESDDDPKLCSDSISISYIDNGTATEMTGTGYIIISFMKGTGAFNCFVNGWTMLSNFTGIKFDGYSKNYIIKIAPETGKHWVEQV